MLSRKEILKLAKEADAYWEHGDFNMPCAVRFDRESDLERFAALVAAQYEQDAKRYRTLRSSERFCVDEKCADGNWEPIHYEQLDVALDEEMEGK